MFNRYPPPRLRLESTDWLYFERAGIELRRIVGVAEDERINPVELASKFNLKIVFPETLNKLSKDVIVTLKNNNSWSGGATKPLSDGSAIIILNPVDSIERRSATLMEEVCHLLLCHQPSFIGLQYDNCRTYNLKVETQAYGVGSATLVPHKSLYSKLNACNPITQIAEHFGVTTSLVLYRIKGLGLSSMIR